MSFTTSIRLHESVLMTQAQILPYPCHIAGMRCTYKIRNSHNNVFQALLEIPSEIQQPREQHGQRPQQARLAARRVQVQPPDLHQQGGRRQLLLLRLGPGSGGYRGPRGARGEEVDIILVSLIEYLEKWKRFVLVYPTPTVQFLYVNKQSIPKFNSIEIQMLETLYNLIS